MAEQNGVKGLVGLFVGGGELAFQAGPVGAQFGARSLTSRMKSWSRSSVSSRLRIRRLLLASVSAMARRRASALLAGSCRAAWLTASWSVSRSVWR